MNNIIGLPVNGVTAASALFLQSCADFRLFVVVVVITCRHFYPARRRRRSRKCWVCGWNFDAICRNSGDI